MMFRFSCFKISSYNKIKLLFRPHGIISLTVQAFFQCYQVRRFLQVLSKKEQGTIVTQIFGDFWPILKSSLFQFNCFGYIYFLHLVTLPCSDLLNSHEHLEQLPLSLAADNKHCKFNVWGHY